MTVKELKVLLAELPLFDDTPVLVSGDGCAVRPTMSCLVAPRFVLGTVRLHAQQGCAETRRVPADADGYGEPVVALIIE